MACVTYACVCADSERRRAKRRSVGRRRRERTLRVGVVMVICPNGHDLRRRTSDGGYDCDGCGRSIGEDERTFRAPDVRLVSLPALPR